VAWEKGHRTQAAGYEYERGKPHVNVDKTVWMDVAPPVLILQMNRSKYNMENGNLEKMQHEVKIESVLKC
jgi:uncharacterized UBP type Zn finger protein